MTSTSRRRRNKRTAPRRPDHALSPAHEAFGRNVDRARVRRGLRWLDVAEKSDIHPSSLSFLKQGKQDATLTQLVRLSTALDTPLEKLVAGVVAANEAANESIPRTVAAASR